MIATVLRRRLIFTPRKLSSALKHFAGLDKVARFYDLVREYLPEEYDDLITMPPLDAADRFVRIFSKRYFPINGVGDQREYYEPGELLNQLTKYISVELHGMKRWTYDSGEIPPGRLLASAICVCPFEAGPGARVALMDRFNKKAEEATKLLPKLGWPPEHVIAVLEDAAYPGLTDWCLYIFSQTGNIWLDNDIYSRSDLTWTRENVEALARDWPSYKTIDKQMKSFNKWAGTNFPARALEVIKYIDKRIPKTLYEIFKGDEHVDQEVE